ncbi:MAG TPA: NAD(P)H-binding protein [Candidatus Kapabacteria bacterium]|nr:NAD(P)H-binding protein [Candidatus Kapabacteria bacterium]
MQILVTGGTGFVGSAVVPALAASGHTVRMVVRAESLARAPHIEGVTAVAGDVLDAGSLAHALEGCSAVVHLVGIRRAEIKRTGRTYEDVDVGSVRSMTAAMARTGVRRILLLSAGAIGNSTYVQCKARAERIVMEAGLDWTIYRPSFILGPGQEWPIVMEPILAAMSYLPGTFGDVARRARAISREQLAGAMAWALDHSSTIGEIFDVPRIRSFSKIDGTHAKA